MDSNYWKFNTLSSVNADSRNILPFFGRTNSNELINSMKDEVSPYKISATQSFEINKKKKKAATFEDDR
jgi:hypothetical protein